MEEPLSPGWEQHTQSQGVTLNSGRSKDHKSCQQEQILISRSSALASAEEFQLVRDGNRAGQRGDVPTHRDLAEHHTELLPPGARLWPSQFELEEAEARDLSQRCR